MGEEPCPGETDPKIWSALNLEEHGIPLGEPRAKLIILGLADWSKLVNANVQKCLNADRCIYIYLPKNLR